MNYVYLFVPLEENDRQTLEQAYETFKAGENNENLINWLWRYEPACCKIS